MTDTAPVVAAVVVLAAVSGVPVVVSDVAIDASETSTEEPGQLVPQGYALEYEGSDVAASTVSIDNRETRLEATVRVELVTVDGATIAVAETTTIIGQGHNEVVVEFDEPRDPTSFALVRTSVESGDL